jgi:hypothetical protein
MQERRESETSTAYFLIFFRQKYRKVKLVVYGEQRGQQSDLFMDACSYYF